MKPHPRIRKTVKWGGAVVTVLLIVAWVGSGRWALNLTTAGRFEAGVSRGRLDLTKWKYVGQGGPPEISWSATNDFRIEWRVLHEEDGKSSYVALPVWILAAPGLILTALAWRLDTLARRRARVGFCPKCNYDRTGLAVTAVCPECGSAPS